MATPHISAEKGDFAKTVLMPGDPLRAKFIADTFLKGVLLAAAPTTPPFIRHWRRSSLLPDRGAKFMLPLSCLSY